MSFNIRNIREISTDQTSKFISHLAKKISDFANANQTQDLEDKEDIYSSGHDVDSVLRFHNFTSTKNFNSATEYFPPNEPDFDKVRIFLRARNQGNSIPDFSGEENPAHILGEPILIDGTPFDDGISTGGTKSLALRFNRPTSPTQNDEGLYIDHATRIRCSEGLSAGISFFIRFRPLTISHQGGSQRTIFEKTDNDPITDGVRARFDNVGRLQFMIENSNVQYSYETSTGVIAPNTIYDCWFTYNKTGNVVKIYVNGVEQTVFSGGSVAYHDTQSNLNYAIFYRGAGSDNGFVYGDLYDFRVYREKVVSQTEVTRMNTNKWTISDIPFGQVMVADYYSASHIGSGGYDSVGYDSTGFDTS
jgi:hypothetical protein